MTTPAVELRMDLFPASVVIAPESPTEVTHHEARLLLGLDEIWVWSMQDGVPTLVLNERYEDVGGARGPGWVATLGDGSTVYFRRSTGCGCGNPLRGWTPPFMTVQGRML